MNRLVQTISSDPALLALLVGGVVLVLLVMVVDFFLHRGTVAAAVRVRTALAEKNLHDARVTARNHGLRPVVHATAAEPDVPRSSSPIPEILWIVLALVPCVAIPLYVTHRLQSSVAGAPELVAAALLACSIQLPLSAVACVVVLHLRRRVETIIRGASVDALAIRLRELADIKGE